MEMLIEILAATWHILCEAAVYMILGILIGGLLKAFLSPAYVLRHLGTGRIASVVKAALLGIPLPLCSCGVLPAAASLKRQGANKGATSAFMISTPESGVDSIAVTYALMDGIMAVARPVSAFIAAAAAGIAENLFERPKKEAVVPPDLSCPVDDCCDGVECPPEEHRRHHGLGERLTAGVRFAYGDVWADLAGWFLVGLLLAGVVTALVPDAFIENYLGGGFSSMLIMLAVGIPFYICATASTPIAAALILKGVSPGAALVFLLAGPATNITSLTMILGVLGRRATAIYLASIAVCAVLCGWALNGVYSVLGVSAAAGLGEAGEFIPEEVKVVAAAILLALSVKPVWDRLRGCFSGGGRTACDAEGGACGCEGSGEASGECRG